MDQNVRRDYIDYIKKQLAEMAKKVKENYSKNQLKRENNVFLIFSDPNAKKYMGMGRSLDSQLGTRLQKIAFFLARRKYGMKNVPNIVVLNDKGNAIQMTTISYSLSLGLTQKVYFSSDDPLSKMSKKAAMQFKKNNGNVIVVDYLISTSPFVIESIKKQFEERNKKGTGIPIDLFYYLNEENDASKVKCIYCYEVKAGGNLDTKNAPSNANEVRSNRTIFSFCPDVVSKFATCYDGKGDGTPDGSIGSNLNEDEIVIGKDFWNEILEPDIGYDEFVRIYEEAYEAAEVEKKLVG